MPAGIDVTIMRGGTSRAVFVQDHFLPADPVARDQVILGIFGSPDPRQIDGLGGADPLTSKLAVIGRPQGPLAETADVVYTFGQVGIAEPQVDWHSLCGNITSAVGVYAVEEGLVTVREPDTRVRVFNTNLQRMLVVSVPAQNGAPLEHGEFVVPGVPGSGAEITVDFADTAGAATGALLPTGRPVDRLTIGGRGEIEASLIDIGNAHVFVRAADLGLKGTESAAEFDSDKGLLARLEAIRGAAAVRMGMIPGPASAARTQSPATPILCLVAPPMDYAPSGGGAAIRAEDVDLVARLQFMQQTHKTYAGTSTVCTGVASRVPGTLVHQVARLRDAVRLRIGHPAGVIETTSVVEPATGGFEVSRATLGRTARRIMQGTAFVPTPSDTAGQTDDRLASAGAK